MTTPNTLLLNPHLAQLPVYKPGRPISEVARELGRPAEEIIKLASNENPNGPSPAALAAMEKELKTLHLYPDGNAYHMKQKLAAKLGVMSGSVTLGNGSNEIIELVGHVLMQVDSEVVVSEYCFAIYPIVAQMFGAKLITVPARHFGQDLNAMVGAITPNTRVMFIANPNNPTGTMASAAELIAVVEAIPPHVLLVVDEAYFEFLTKPCDLLPYIRSGSRPNLLLMRTFSKIYGLAGLRLGYGIGHPDLIAALEKVRQPFNINSLAQAGALAALDDTAHVEKTRKANLEGLLFFEQAFKGMRLEFVPSVANFILVRVEEGQSIVDALQQKGVIVRPMSGYGLPEWIRISIGTEAENKRCLNALRDVILERQ